MPNFVGIISARKFTKDSPSRSTFSAPAGLFCPLSEATRQLITAGDKAMGPRNKNADSPSQPQENAAEFPSARYFQVHFQYLEDLLCQLGQELDALKLQIEDFYRDPRREKNGPTLPVPCTALAPPFEPTATRDQFKTSSEPHTFMTQRKLPPDAFVTQCEMPPEG
jgi:hypothetical protein